MVSAVSPSLRKWPRSCRSVIGPFYIFSCLVEEGEDRFRTRYEELLLKYISVFHFEFKTTFPEYAKELGLYFLFFFAFFATCRRLERERREKWWPRNDQGRIMIHIVVYGERIRPRITQFMHRPLSQLNLCNPDLIQLGVAGLQILWPFLLALPCYGAVRVYTYDIASCSCVMEKFAFLYA